MQQCLISKFAGHFFKLANGILKMFSKNVYHSKTKSEISKMTENKMDKSISGHLHITNQH